MGRVQGLLGGEPAAGPGIVNDLLNEVDVGESPLSDLPQNPEAVLVDPDIAAPVHRVV